jgi:hypothetical protein
MRSILGELLKRKTIAKPTLTQSGALYVQVALASNPFIVSFDDDLLDFVHTAALCVKLYRQRAVGDWDDLFARVATDLHRAFQVR